MERKLTSKDLTRIKKIGERIKELRSKNYTSYETFAFENEIPRVQYGRLERGAVNFRMATLMRVLDIHKISLEDFFKGIK
ncbi:MAG: helix-turn-helix transcriptional regulator [Bacteroidia bacterium]